jgi:hypothetical protein
VTGRVLVVPLLCLISLGACDVTISGDKPDTSGHITRTAFVEEAEARAHVELDLRRVPTRAETGIGDGQDIAIFEWRDQRPIETVLQLPGDVPFTFGAAHLDVVARDAVGPPEEVRMQAPFADMDAARTELLRAVEVLGDPGRAGAFNAAAVESWYQAKRPHYGDPRDDGAFADEVFTGRPLGLITVEATASLNGTEGVTVLYSFQLPVS